MQLTTSLTWLVRMSSDVETNIVAVEKVKEYSDTEKEVHRNKPLKAVRHSVDILAAYVACLEKGFASYVSLNMCLDPQAEWKHEPSTLSPGWPTNGCIEMRNFGLRYRQDLDLAIRNITISINGGEKVGFT